MLIRRLTVLQADRGGKAAQFALQYEGSEEKAAADKTLAGLTARGGDLSSRTTEALQANRATATPFWWGWLTLLKVLHFPTLCSQRLAGQTAWM
jgi:hypothetical protein